MARLVPFDSLEVDAGIQDDVAVMNNMRSWAGPLGAVRGVSASTGDANGVPRA